MCTKDTHRSGVVWAGFWCGPKTVPADQYFISQHKSSGKRKSDSTQWWPQGSRLEHCPGARRQLHGTPRLCHFISEFWFQIKVLGAVKLKRAISKSDNKSNRHHYLGAVELKRAHSICQSMSRGRGGNDSVNCQIFSRLWTLAKCIISVNKYDILERCYQYQDSLVHHVYFNYQYLRTLCVLNDFKFLFWDSDTVPITYL